MPSSPGCRIEAHGWINGQWHPVTVTWGPSTAEVTVDERHRFTVHRSGVFHPGPPAESPEDRNTGLADILHAAWHGLFALHASGVSQGAASVAILGESGDGKSTLAATLAREDAASRVADDLLLVQHRDGNAYPVAIHQPKLPAGDQRYGLVEAPLSALLWLERSSESAALVPLTRADVFQRINAASVAARLLPPELLGSQFQWACALAEHVPGYVLRRPWGLAHLPIAQRLVCRLLDRAGG